MNPTRERPAILPTHLSPDLPAAGAPPAWLAVRRDELALLVTGYRQAVRARRMWAVTAVGVGAIAGLPLWYELLERAGLAGAVPEYAPLAAAWAVMFVCMATLWRWTLQLRAKYQFTCPACSARLLDGSVERGQMTPLELVVATGHCPRCGARVVAD